MSTTTIQTDNDLGRWEDDGGPSTDPAPASSEDGPRSRLTYRERRLRRAERLNGWAEKRQQQAEGLHTHAEQLLQAMPTGQPILIGHHSEKSHRAHIRRMHSAVDKAYENDAKADRMRSRAAEIERQAANAIYNDDPDAIVRLREKIAALEGERERMKATNQEYRRTHKAELKSMTAYQRSQAVPYPAWQITNLGGNISRSRQRLALLESNSGVA